jgi:hypothetical protein
MGWEPTAGEPDQQVGRGRGSGARSGN